MNEDAFARRFYADRAELESLGIQLSVEKPADSLYEQENYSLAPENFHLPAIEFTDSELAALHTALSLLDGEFAYAEPLRLALQQISWGRPNPLKELGAAVRRARHHRGRRRARPLAAPLEDRHRDLPAQDDRVRVLHDGARPEEQAQGRPLSASSSRAGSSTSSASPTSAKPCACSGCRASSARSPTRPRPSTTSSGPPTSTRASTQSAGPGSSATRSTPPRSGWPTASPGRSSVPSAQYGEMGEERDGGRVFRTEYGAPRQLISWVLGFGENARVLGPRPLVADFKERLKQTIALHTAGPDLARASRARAEQATVAVAVEANGRREGAIRPERFARLVTLASVLIAAGREGRRLPVRRRARPAPDLRAGAARGHQRPQRRQLRRRLVRALRRGARLRRDRRRSRALLRQLRAARAAAAGRGQGARGGHRPDRRAHPRGVARIGAREDRRRARGGPRARGPAGHQRRWRGLRGG